MRPVVLITGASGGIGLELAKIFAEKKQDLVLVARSAQKLESLQKELTECQGVRVDVIPKDLSRREAARELFEEVRSKGLFVEILVNNAGVGSFGAFAEIELSAHENQMDLNMVSLTQLTRLFLQPMLERKRGKIMNVASTAAFQPGPMMAVYYASKAYVLHLSEALADELRGSGVTVTALCPGPTRTGFQEKADMGGSKLFRSAVMSAESVAREGYLGLMRGQAVVITGFRNKLLANSARFAPRSLMTRIVRKIQEKDKSGLV